MRIHVVGGGPAGLYFAILAKLADPRRDVTVFERHRPRETEGWGIVLSARTCEDLAQVDPETWAPIGRELIAWDTITVLAHGQRVQAGGHAFCGAARDRFIALLHQRADALGVRLRFETPVDDPEPLRDCDLLVAADGIGSVCRQRWEDAFETSHALGESRFIWLGTRKRFDTFTFSFRQSAHGVFQIHAYPFSESTSTCIVECHESTWRRAGLDAAGEAYSAAYCAELFRSELEGHPLLSNRSAWSRFDTLRSARWHHDNVVLVGDAAHTAHFSIGSGTKLALEDVVSLARAIDAEDGVPAALAAYERDRKPQVERMQAIADESRRWFEGTDRTFGLPTPQLAFSLLSRVSKVTHGSLSARHVDQVANAERWLAQSHGAPAGTAPEAVPFALGALRLEGRLVAELRPGAPMDAVALVLVRTDGRDAGAQLEAARRTGRPVVARLDRAALRSDRDIVETAAAVAALGFDGGELWLSPHAPIPPQVALVEAVRTILGPRPLIARWDADDGLELARALAGRVTALHVPAARSEILRNELAVPAIAVAPTTGLDWPRTALLAGRADLVSLP